MMMLSKVAHLCQMSFQVKHLFLPFFPSTPQPTVNGGECQPGYYCPEGSHQQTPCTPGLYCELAGLHAPTNSCEPAYYCPSGSSSPQEEPCPVGHYCPLETAIPVPCSNGTYNPSIKQDEASDCLPCEAGYYCNETGASTTSGECAPRKLCQFLIPTKWILLLSCFLMDVVCMCLAKCHQSTQPQNAVMHELKTCQGGKT